MPGERLYPKSAGQHLAAVSGRYPAFGLRRHTKDYAALSATPDQFDAFVKAVGHMMETEPNYSAGDLARIHLPVAIVQSERDEFIKRDHADYLARSIPTADLIILPGVSHFAPLQRPEGFNNEMLGFLDKVLS